MIIKLEEVKFNGKNKKLADHILNWIEQQDSAVTVRRVFYAMVTRQHIDNTQNEYSKISKIVLKLRRGGFLDWDAIEDTTRSSHKSPNYNNVNDCLYAALKRFRLKRWEGQKNYVEVWVEKRGHVSILYPTTNALDVSITECGGRMALNFDIVEKLIEAQQQGKRNHILYVGDYDPSGLSIDRNLQSQLEQWGITADWKRVSLTYDQIREYNLIKAYMVMDKISPKLIKKRPDIEILGYDIEGNPLANKLDKDTSSKAFKAAHNGELFQVEVDAVEVPILRQLIKENILRLLDIDSFNECIEREEEERIDIIEKLNA